MTAREYVRSCSCRSSSVTPTHSDAAVRRLPPATLAGGLGPIGHGGDGWQWPCQFSPRLIPGRADACRKTVVTTNTRPSSKRLRPRDLLSGQSVRPILLPTTGLGQHAIDAFYRLFEGGQQRSPEPRQPCGDLQCGLLASFNYSVRRLARIESACRQRAKTNRLVFARRQRQVSRSR